MDEHSSFLRGTPSFGTRSPYVLQLKQYFLGIPDTSAPYHSQPRQGIRNQVFTDSSFFQGTVFNLDRAAWAVVNASSNQSVSYGHVPGLHQFIGRAELWAIISPVSWAVSFDVDMTIWTDSASTCDRANRLLHLPQPAVFSGDNHDLWQQLAETLAQTLPGQVEIRWTPSHVDLARCETLHEDFWPRGMTLQMPMQ